MTGTDVCQTPDLAAAVRRAVAAIVAAQHADGHWSDFEIPQVGIAAAWVTAHVGLKLQSLPAPWRQTDVAAALTKAADYLLANGRSIWRYSDYSPPDADSTAHAMLFLQSIGRAVPRTSLTFLLAHQQLDGGFATFLAGPGTPPSHSWCISHPDVTALATRAIVPYRSDPEIANRIGRARRYMANVHDEEGRWPVFWWDLDWYTVANWRETLTVMGQTEQAKGDAVAVRAADPRSDLDAGLLLQLLTSLGNRPQARPLAVQLAGRQRDDGLWPTIPVLRVTRPDVRKPWLTSQGGPLYPDHQRVYSGATVVASIAAFLHWQSGSAKNEAVFADRGRSPLERPRTRWHP